MVTSGSPARPRLRRKVRKAGNPSVTFRPWRVSGARNEREQGVARDKNFAIALRWWMQGEIALDAGDPARAILCYRQCLAADIHFARAYLGLANAYLEKGKDKEASACLRTYLQARPNKPLVRYYHAELLSRMHQWEDARNELIRFVADAQASEVLARKQLVSAHTRLMEIAERLGDPFGTHLHRGIGLYLLGCRRARLPNPDEGLLPTEGLLFEAAEELRQAQRHRPGSPRPCWYLHQVWALLGQSRLSRVQLRLAWQEAWPGIPPVLGFPLADIHLTPSEHRALRRAWLSCQ